MLTMRILGKSDPVFLHYICDDLWGVGQLKAEMGEQFGDEPIRFGYDA